MASAAAKPTGWENRSVSSPAGGGTPISHWTMISAAPMQASDDPPRAGALRSLAAVAHAEEGNEKSQRCRRPQQIQRECRCPGDQGRPDGEGACPSGRQCHGEDEREKHRRLATRLPANDQAQRQASEGGHCHAVRPDAGVCDPVTAQARPCRGGGLGSWRLGCSGPHNRHDCVASRLCQAAGSVAVRPSSSSGNKRNANSGPRCVAAENRGTCRRFLQLVGYVTRSFGARVSYQ